MEIALPSLTNSHHRFANSVSMGKTWCLEVVRFLTNEEEWRAAHSKRIHIGYMDAHFKTKGNAASYYNRNNPHMRPLNAHNTWSSDWDPETHLLYIVREYKGVAATVPPFDPADASAIEDGVQYQKTSVKWLQ